MIYLDHAAATAVDPRVLEAMLPWFRERFANPQSIHQPGSVAREAIEESRAQVAALIGADPDEVLFTSSGTESNNLALKGLTPGRQARGRHIIVSQIEHVSVLSPARTLARAGFEVSELGVQSDGRVALQALQDALRPDTILISIQTASSEVGTIQPVAEIGRLCRERNVIFHTDAVAAAGVIPIDVRSQGIDALTLSAQSLLGPKGAAALYVRKGLRLVPQLEGGNQERNRRAGTENVPAIVGLGRAAELARVELEPRAARVRALRDRLIQELPAQLERVYLTGHPIERLPGHASFCIEFIEGEAVLLMLEDQGIIAASGSACTSKALRASHVLLALGYDHALAQGSLVFTLGPENQLDEITALLERLPPIVDHLRAMSPLYARYRKDPEGYDLSQRESRKCIANE